MTQDTTPDGQRQYSERNELLQQVIDVLAGYDPSEINKFGMKSQIARDHDIERHRIHYVMSNYTAAVQWRRRANADPTDNQAVKAAYTDDTLRDMASVASDGAGDIRVSVELSLDEVFRAIKLLPGDLGLKVYTQVLAEDFDRHVISEVLDE
jgi:hypothetical protein